MRILVVEDDSALAAQLRDALDAAGYSVDCTIDGVDGEFLGMTEEYDAVILDLGLPNMDGLTILEHWRGANCNMPVLVLTARDTWTEKVAGFDAGADDYVGKPFHIEEILARLRALIRRCAGHADATLESSGIRLDTRSGKVAVGERPVDLTAQEYRLLTYMMHHDGDIVSRGELIEHLYSRDADPGSNTIEVFISRLRRKIGGERIETLKGQGYRLGGLGDD